ncbi:uncharacterized protein LOC108197639 isoform X2 [Daucus carota subsp. sativus]|uniref:uncharacterized protein LOC108197639 isoform X2 n=1 Tax=Daucus carota subsp. sativus TaxID=79200 RepID=UPI0007EFF1C6|nr:PREDICTED: uncharacterized protein LOC108197639 isoform X2 [Daucus carota subsp. sativus]
MSSRSANSLDKVTADVAAVAKRMHLKVLGPFMIPPKIMCIRSRLGPGPNGNNLHGYFKLCIYENLIEVFSSTEVVEQIIAGSNECNVKIEVTVGVRGGSSKQGQVGESFLSQLPKGSEKQLQQIKIRMSSRRLQILNKVTADFVAVAKGMHLKVLGPGGILKKAVNMTRLAPGPDGTNLGGNFKFKLLHIYENFAEVFSSTEEYGAVSRAKLV